MEWGRVNEDDDLGEKMPGIRRIGKATVNPPPLQEGDTIVQQVTHEVEAFGNRMWVRFGASTTVQPGESGEQARKRLRDEVRRGVEQSIQDSVQHAQEMSK